MKKHTNTNQQQHALHSSEVVCAYRNQTTPAANVLMKLILGTQRYKKDINTIIIIINTTPIILNTHTNTNTEYKGKKDIYTKLAGQ